MLIIDAGVSPKILSLGGDITFFDVEDIVHITAMSVELEFLRTKGIKAYHPIVDGFSTPEAIQEIYRVWVEEFPPEKP